MCTCTQVYRHTGLEKHKAQFTTPLQASKEPGHYQHTAIATKVSLHQAAAALAEPKLQGLSGYLQVNSLTTPDQPQYVCT